MKNLFSSIIAAFLVLLLSLVFSIKKVKTDNNDKSHLIDSLTTELVLTDSLKDNFADFLPMGSPLDTIDISSEYGARPDPETGYWEIHEGLDLRGIWTDTVYATGSGIVKLSGFCGGYGRCVLLEHGSGYKSRYAHMTKLFVKRSEFVQKGQPIGTVGNSGHVTGFHLHYEILKDGVHIDPLKWILLNESDFVRK